MAALWQRITACWAAVHTMSRHEQRFCVEPTWLPFCGSKLATGWSSCRTSHTLTQPSAPQLTISGGPHPCLCNQWLQAQLQVKVVRRQIGKQRCRSVYLATNAINLVDEGSVSLCLVHRLGHMFKIPHLHMESKVVSCPITLSCCSGHMSCAFTLHSGTIPVADLGSFLLRAACRPGCLHRMYHI